MDEIDVYPVGLLRDLLQARLYWKKHHSNHKSRIRAVFVLIKAEDAVHHRHAVRLIKHQAKKILKYTLQGNWRALKSNFNGYLAEPRNWPEGLHRCGTGWTRKRALKSLDRRMDRMAGI